MAINFPDSPSIGDTYTSGGRTWQWDGSVWSGYGNFVDPSILKIDTVNNRVGVNNVSPAADLDVTGNISVSSDVTVQGNLAVGSITNVESNISTIESNVSTAQSDISNLETRPVETKTASYTLVAGDVNKRIVMNSASATTITVDDAVFSAGDTVWIHNIGAGTTTVTAGTATVNTAGSLDVAQWEGGSLYFTSASSAIFFRGGGASLNAFAADLFVAGSGGGGADGGGGAGQYNYAPNQFLPLGTSLDVTISAGGSPSGGGGQARLGWTVMAGTTRIGGYIAHGGGSGGNSGVAGMTGACGGGSGRSYIGQFGNYPIIQGGTGRGIPSGRNGGQTNTAEASGGGGAAESGNVDSMGHGGDGLANSITGTSTYYCGGGAGNGATNSGGLGGGGNNGVAGTANTGGGGGGGNNNGGSGVVIVRWLTGDATPTIGAGLTTTSGTDGDYTVLTITGGTDTISWS